MCRRAAAPWVLAGLLVAAPLTAQDSPDLAGLEARLDALLNEASALDARVEAEREAYDRSTRASLEEPTERIVDGLRIRALPRDMDAAVDLFTTTWREAFQHRFGAPPAAMLDAGLGYYDHRGEWNPRVGEGRSNAYFVQVSTVVDDPRYQAERALGKALLHAAPVSVREWTADWNHAPRIGWLAIRRQLAAAPSTSAQACFDGDLPSCTATLGLRPKGWDKGHVVAAWYSPGVRRDVLARAHWIDPDTPPEDLSAAQAFLQWHDEFRMPAGDDVSPGRLVRRGGNRIRWELGPADAETRASLFLLAVDLGGAGAMDRLAALDPRAPLETALEAVAHRPVHELVSEWRAHLLAEVDPVDRRTPARSTLAWVGLLAVFAMTSTRWRVGR